MNKYTFSAAMIILLLLSSPLFSREDDEGRVEELSEQPELAEQPELSLYEKTMIKDIETAGYYELVAWCRTLELSDQGNTQALRSQLYKFYGLTPVSTQRVNENVSIITVRSAYNTDYFTIEENGEQMIVLKGNVEVEMEEQGVNPRRHIILSDELVFNQAQQIITARGNLKYTLVTGETEDVFYGDSLEFSITSWSGVIFKGKSLRKEMVEDKEYTFYFNGETIRKSGKGGIFILDEGIIKTQDVENPDFQLKATKLWLMGPQEWGVLNGILYIGHVPILYIPFYYKPGNELIFNPVIGNKTRQGTFLQTTTYLIGEKEIDNDFSFFSLGSSSDQEYELVREGFFLMKEEKVNSAPDASADSLKIMADWYSRLGAYSGIAGSFSNKKILNNLEFTSGMAVSRNIDSNGNIYFEDDNNEYVPQWNSTVLGDKELPFRWGQDLTFSMAGVSGDFRFYSDPYFNEDFMDREESYDWLNSILTSDPSEEGIPDAVTDMDWNLAYSQTFQPNILKPFVNSISINPVRFNLEWNRRDNGEVENALSPSRTFFYPEKIVLPYAQVSISGTPLSFSTRDGWGWASEADPPDKEEDSDPLMPPWDKNEKEKEEDIEDENTILPGDYWTELFQNQKAVLYASSFTYNISYLINVEGYTNNLEWDDPSDVSFEMDESTMLRSNRLSTDFNNRFFDSRVLLLNNNTYTNNQRSHMNAFGLDQEDVDYDQKLNDYRSNSVDWNNKLSSQYYPLKYRPDFSSSNFNYNIDNQLYKKTFKSYIDGEMPVYNEIWAGWDEETVNQHKTGMLVKYDTGTLFMASDSSFILPPLNKKETYAQSAGYDIFHWRSTVSQTIVKEEEEWTFQPLIFTSVYTPIENISLQQTLEYDFEQEHLTKSFSRVETFGFYVAYTHEYTTPYNWDIESYSWIQEEDAFVPSRFNTGYTMDLIKDPYWKNRMYFDTNLNMDWQVNLQKFNDNSLSFNWEFKYNVFQFLDLKFSMTSSNKNMYLYSEYYRDKLGIQEDYSFWNDLYKSVNIFSPDQQDRYSSNFNLEKIGLELVHHLRDWDLTFLYSGYPKLEDESYDWYSEFSIALVWNPIPQIKSLVQRKDKEWSVDNR